MLRFKLSSLYRITCILTIFLNCQNLFGQSPKLVYDANKEWFNPIANNLNTAGNSRLYFWARTQKYGKNTWLTDGTAAGTKVKPDWENSTNEAQYVHELNRGVIIQYRNSSNHQQLYYYKFQDSTYSRMRFASEEIVLNLSDFQMRNDSVYFIGQQKDSSSADIFFFVEGDTFIHHFFEGSSLNLSTSSIPYPLNGVVVFQDYQPNLGNEWWKTDGTPTGTEILKEIEPGTANNFINNPFLLGDKLYFSAVNTANGSELWETDGTSANTKITKETIPGTGGSFAGVHYTAKDTAIVSLWNQNGGREFYLLMPGSPMNSFLSYGKNKNFTVSATHWNNSHAFILINDNGSNPCFYSDGTALGTTEFDTTLFPTGFHVGGIQLATNHLFFKLFKPGEQSIIAIPSNNLSTLIWYKNTFGDSLSSFSERISSALPIDADLFSIEYGDTFPNELARYSVENNTIKRTVISTISTETEHAENLEVKLTPHDIYFSHTTDSLEVYHSHGTPTSTRLLGKFRKGSQLIQFDSNEVFVLQYKDSAVLYPISPNGVAAKEFFNLNNPHIIRNPVTIDSIYFFIEEYSVVLKDLKKYTKQGGLVKVYDFVPGENDNASIIEKWNNSLIISAREQKDGRNHLWRYDEQSGSMSKIIDDDPKYGTISEIYHFNDSGFYYFTFTNTSNINYLRVWFYNLYQNSKAELGNYRYQNSYYPWGDKSSSLFNKQLLWISGDLYLTVSDYASGSSTTLLNANGDSMIAQFIIGIIDSTLLFLQTNPDNTRSYASFNFSSLEYRILGDSFTDASISPEYSFSPFTTFIHDDKLYFNASTRNPSIGQLWRYDPSTDKTRNITQFNYQALAGTNPSIVGFKNDTLLFMANEAQYGRELWSYHTGCANADIQIDPICQGEVFSGQALLEEYETPFREVYWTFSNGDSINGSQFNYTLIDSIPLSLKLTAEAGPNCRLEINQSIKAYARTSSTYQLSKDSLCLNSNLFTIEANDINSEKTFSWQWDEEHFSQGNPSSYSFKNAGLKQVKVQSNIYGACPDSASFIFTVLPSPSIPNIIGPSISNSRIDTFYTNKSSGLTYTWSSSIGQMTNNQGDTISIFDWQGNTGNAQVFLQSVNEFNCSSDSQFHTISIQPNGFSFSEENDALLLYPNPTKDLITLQALSQIIESVKVFDMSGKLLMQEATSSNQSEMSISLSSLPAGIYMVQVQVNGQPMNRIISKQ